MKKLTIVVNNVACNIIECVGVYLKRHDIVEHGGSWKKSARVEKCKSRKVQEQKSVRVEHGGS
jgi:hypothetical protein